MEQIQCMVVQLVSSEANKNCPIKRAKGIRSKNKDGQDVNVRIARSTKSSHHSMDQITIPTSGLAGALLGSA